MDGSHIRRNVEMPKRPTEQFFVRNAPTIQEAIEARDAGHKRMIKFTYLEGTTGKETLREILGICLGVRQVNERDEATYWIFLKTSEGYLLLTYNPLDRLLHKESFSQEAWKRLLEQTDFHE